LGEAKKLQNGLVNILYQEGKGALRKGNSSEKAGEAQVSINHVKKKVNQTPDES